MNIFDKVLKKMNFVIKTGIIILLFLMLQNELNSQPNYSAWHFRDGNLSGSKRGGSGFYIQNIDSFRVKWATPDISGDVTPLIGNLVDNTFEGISFTQPLEMTALMGDEIVIIGGSGVLLKKQKLPAYAQNVKAFTVLFDSMNTGFSNYANNTVLIGSESIEFFNPNSTDTLAHSYIFGYDAELDSIKVVKRLSIDLRDFAPNVSASIKPFYGRRVGGRLMVYTVIDMNKPIISGSSTTEPEFFRGFAQFYDDDQNSIFPLPDMKDQKDLRIHLASDVGLYQPSVQLLANNFTGVLLPWQSSVQPNINISELVGGGNFNTSSGESYLLGFNIAGAGLANNFSPRVIPVNGTRSILRPIYAELDVSANVRNNFILVAEQYSGIDGSDGESKLHLYTQGGAPITGTPQSSVPPLSGGRNHYWSVGVGNIDGISSNSWGKYYPNNPGNEIVVTQSSKESVFPESRLYIMRYRLGAPIEKPTPSGDTLFQFDTIATSRVNGWLAAVADIDLHPDGKDEIILVDGSKLMVLRMRDYQDVNFRLGYPFDTVYTKEFRKQTISNVAIADLEGDGRPDIIVTTFDSTYVIGSIIENTIVIDCPQKEGISDFCLNDTINLRWQNIIMGQPNVNILFERLDPDGNLIDTLVIQEFADNNNEFVDFQVQAGTNLFKGTNFRIIRGRFIIQGTDYPEKINAASCYLSIYYPEINLISTLPALLETGDLLSISASVSCIDSVSSYYKVIDTTGWNYIGLADINSGQADFNFIIPCFSDIFDCGQSSQIERYIDLMFVTHINGYSDTVYYSGIQIIPKKLQFTIDEKLTADPSIIVRWNPSQFAGIIPCSEISISVSLDGGFTFNQIGTSNVSDAFYKWNVPYNIQDNLILRLCCLQEACFRADSSITGVTPNYVNIIAPNPFNPEREIMEFVYKIPESLNISVSIYDQSNRLVKQILKDVPRTADIVYTDYWDGARADGSYAANGLYYLILDLSNGKREIHQVFLGK